MQCTTISLLDDHHQTAKNSKVAIVLNIVAPASPKPHRIALITQSCLVSNEKDCKALGAGCFVA